MKLFTIDVDEIGIDILQTNTLYTSGYYTPVFANRFSAAFYEIGSSVVHDFWLGAR